MIQGNRSVIPFTPAGVIGFGLGISDLGTPDAADRVVKKRIARSREKPQGSRAAQRERRRELVGMLEAGASLEEVVAWYDRPRKHVQVYLYEMGWTMARMDEVRAGLGLPPHKALSREKQRKTYPHRDRPATVTEEQIKEVTRLRAIGRTWKEVAEALDVQTFWIQRRYYAYVHAGHRPSALASARKAHHEVRRMVVSGASVDDISVHLDRSRASTVSYLNKLGIKLADMDKIRKRMGLSPASRPRGGLRRAA